MSGGLWNRAKLDQQIIDGLLLLGANRQHTTETESGKESLSTAQ
jgi:hypothetical protein